MENEAHDRGRDVSLDVFKGFCLLLVMLLHIQSGKGATWLGAWANPFKLAGFFAVSGYLLSLKPLSGGFGEAIGRKWRGLMRPYFFFGFLALAVLLPLKTHTLSGATAVSNAIVSQMAFLRGYSTLWFLPVLFVAETLFIGTVFIERRLRNRFGRAAALVYPLSVVAATCLSAWLSPVAAPYIRLPQNRQLVANLSLTWLRALPAFVCVAAGYFAYGRLLSAVKRNALAAAGASVVLMAIGFVTGRMLGGIDWNNNVYGGNICLFLVSGIASSFGLMLAFNLITRRASMPVMRFVGLNSLVIMATHLPLPFIQYAREISAWLCVRVAPLGSFLYAHFTLDSLLVLAIVLVLELPLVFLFSHAPLNLLLRPRK